MIDIHMHVIPDVDDGAGSLEESIEMLRCAAAQGVTAVIATPHNSVFDFEYRRVRDQFRKLKKAVRDLEIPVDLFPGSEILCYRSEMDLIISLLREGIYPTMNGTDYVLVEFFPNISVRDAVHCLTRFQEAGFMPIIAHAERYRFIDAGTAEALRAAGILIQMNVYSALDETKDTIRERADMLLRNHLVDMTGSDAHRMDHRPPVYENGINYLYRVLDRDYVDRILCGNARERLVRGRV